MARIPIVTLFKNINSPVPEEYLDTLEKMEFQTGDMYMVKGGNKKKAASKDEDEVVKSLKYLQPYNSSFKVEDTSEPLKTHIVHYIIRDRNIDQ